MRSSRAARATSTWKTVWSKAVFSGHGGSVTLAETLRKRTAFSPDHVQNEDERFFRAPGRFSPEEKPAMLD